MKKVFLTLMGVFAVVILTFAGTVYEKTVSDDAELRSAQSVRRPIARPKLRRIATRSADPPDGTVPFVRVMSYSELQVMGNLPSIFVSSKSLGDDLGYVAANAYYESSSSSQNQVQYTPLPLGISELSPVIYINEDDSYEILNVIIEYVTGTINGGKGNLITQANSYRIHDYGFAEDSYFTRSNYNGYILLEDLSYIETMNGGSGFWYPMQGDTDGVFHISTANTWNLAFDNEGMFYHLNNTTLNGGTGARPAIYTMLRNGELSIENTQATIDEGESVQIANPSFQWENEWFGEY